MKKKSLKIILLTLFGVFNFVGFVSLSILTSPKNIKPIEYVSAHIKKGTYIEFYNSRENNKGLTSSTDWSLYSLTNKAIFGDNFIYYESYNVGLNNRPIYLSDNEYSKIIISNYDNDANKFNVNLLKGRYPSNTRELLISENLAEKYKIDNQTIFPFKLNIESLVNREKINREITVSGIYKFDNNNMFLTKPDRYGNDCQSNVFIGSSIDYEKGNDYKNDFGYFQGILLFNESNIATNESAFSRFYAITARECSFDSYSSFWTTRTDDLLSKAIEVYKSGEKISNYVYKNTTLFATICILSFSVALASACVTFFISEPQMRFDFYRPLYFVYFASLCVVGLLLMLKPYMWIGESLIMLVTHYSSFSIITAALSGITICCVIDFAIGSKQIERLHRRQIDDASSNKDYLVSVIIPNYNGEKYICDAIDSVLKQTYKNIEIIVVDDGSTDDSVALIKIKYKDKIKIIQKENGGVSSALNRGIKEMKGQFFSWLSHDDLYDESSIEQRLVTWFDLGNDPKTVIGTKTKYIDENGNTIQRFALPNHNISRISDFLSYSINGCSLLIHRDNLVNIKFREDMKYMQDYYLWASFIQNKQEIICLNSKLTKTRIHSQQVTSNSIEQMEKDFAYFEETYIEPLLKEENVEEIKRIMHAMERKLSLHPFFEKYIEKYKEFLKSKNKYYIESKVYSYINSLISKCVLKLRSLRKSSNGKEN